MKIKFRKYCLVLMIFFGGLAILSGLNLLQNSFKARTRAAEGQKIVTIYDKNQKRTVLTERNTVAEVLVQAGIVLDKFDLIEPSLETEISDGFNVNIFRARPLTVIDGEREIKLLTPYQLASDIAKAAGLELYNEDRVEFGLNSFGLSSDIGATMTIYRATAFNLNFFGKNSVVRTQAQTVGEFLSQKQIKLGANDKMNLTENAKIVSDMTLEIWQEGEQEITTEEEVAFSVRSVKNYEKPVGYKEIQQAGKKGKRLVTYKIEIRNGQEVARVELRSVVTEEAVEQIEVIGAKSSGGLTMSKGVNNYTDSNGVTHRETYYDLPMSVVMRNCGAGGQYTVREDGVKIDTAGYVIVAAHLGNYPRCSVVETSLGLGKVYDTGGFTAVHPHGFDLATDWTKRDGI